MRILLVLLAITEMVQAQPVVMVGLDLTQSMAQPGYDGRTELDRAWADLAGVIQTLPAGADFTIAAITDKSFSQPLVLSTRRLPRDRGPLQFLDQVSAAKSRILAEARNRAPGLRFAQTDVLGFLVYASDALKNVQPRSKILVILSDMRQSTMDLDFDTPATIDIAAALRAVEQRRLVADLREVEVYVGNVHATGKSPAYWEALRQFWSSYFKKSGANLRTFSMHLNVPLTPANGQ